MGRPVALTGLEILWRLHVVLGHASIENGCHCCRVLWRGVTPTRLQCGCVQNFMVQQAAHSLGRSSTKSKGCACATSSSSFHCLSFSWRSGSFLCGGSGMANSEHVAWIA